MKTIEIDFEVWRELTNRRETEHHTYNDVIRELLGLEKTDKDQESETSDSGIPLIADGVIFPHDTEFRKFYKGQYYYGKIENGFLVVDGKKFLKPSPAAMHITKNLVNGWQFWECKLPGETNWIKINRLRKTKTYY